MNSLFAIPAWMDLVAVGIGAAQGAMFSSRYRGAELDLLGVAIIGIVSGFGGSILRDLLLSTEIAAFQTNWYLVTAVICAMAGMLVSSLWRRVEMVINVFDALK
ncbi:MAG: TRIC cation channel family protein [Chloroflexi bacterium]|nr:TRIC cation channel family protein [Chloroflexota bacterium]